MRCLLFRLYFTGDAWRSAVQNASSPTMKKLLLFACAFAGILGSARAADPTNPILFVTQVPMPEEVNTRKIVDNYMSCVSPFGSHLGGTAFAGRGGSLWVRLAEAWLAQKR